MGLPQPPALWKRSPDVLGSATSVRTVTLATAFFPWGPESKGDSQSLPLTNLRSGGVPCVCPPANTHNFPGQHNPHLHSPSHPPSPPTHTSSFCSILPPSDLHRSELQSFPHHIPSTLQSLLPSVPSCPQHCPSSDLPWGSQDQAQDSSQIPMNTN